MIFENYNSALSLSNYTIGNAYILYIHNLNLNRLTNANEEIISKYSSILTEVGNDDYSTCDDSKCLNLSRVIGIIVDKHKANDDRCIDKITAMFKTDDEQYVLNTYVVNTKDVFTDNKDFISPSAVLRTVWENLRNNL